MYPEETYPRHYRYHACELNEFRFQVRFENAPDAMDIAFMNSMRFEMVGTRSDVHDHVEYETPVYVAKSDHDGCSLARGIISLHFRVVNSRAAWYVCQYLYNGGQEHHVLLRTASSFANPAVVSRKRFESAVWEIQSTEERPRQRDRDLGRQYYNTNIQTERGWKSTQIWLKIQTAHSSYERKYAQHAQHGGYERLFNNLLLKLGRALPHGNAKSRAASSSNRGDSPLQNVRTQSAALNPTAKASSSVYSAGVSPMGPPPKRQPTPPPDPFVGCPDSRFCLEALL